ncbi:hypothetical protein FHT82_005795 [Rhizobium sp. BK275]|nr:hypothetical protein [Rhizobium sp. BK275]MBB3409642.1 hypothetical protein [Rhizobium sp. BK316]
MFFGELVSSDNIKDEHAFRFYAIEGDMPFVKDTAKAGADRSKRSNRRESPAIKKHDHEFFSI